MLPLARPSITLLLITLFTHVHITSPTPLPNPQLGSGADIQEDTGQVTITDPHDDDISVVPNLNLAITATIFDSVPGPKSCRGRVMVQLEVPRPDGLGQQTCYNMPQPAGCGNFVANKEDGCEAKLFAEPNCRSYMNTAVFIPDDSTRAVGGLWRSMSVQCGIPAPDPETLGAPPLQDMMRNAKKKKKKPASRQSH
ncbi:hypothetical protein QBC46DRAFT_283556 [Diplogelasinospora grovesii]|uniref:Uncharacterized protein n=1 Tax=Diplogelasinospora grovesii TaxID=303347 RepID=A0AAN6NBB2_9PEZI|nr:hypothetical protein QBC46DRAFT_283556 [Diplogelasinospora grovesii]